jgi:hypothetical protein
MKLKKNYLPTEITFIGNDLLEKIKDDFAIQVLEYYHNNLFFIPLKKGEAKKILQHIKKQN